MIMDATPFERWRYGTWRSLGVGLVAGAVEAAWLAATTQLPLRGPEFVVLAVTAIVAMGVFGLAAGAVAGVVHAFTRKKLASRAIAIQFGLVVAAVTGWYLGLAAVGVWLEQRDPFRTAVLLGMPFGFGAVAFFNASFWLRKVEVGKEYRLSFVAMTAIAAVAIAGAAGAGRALRATAGFGDPARPNVLLITIDTLRRDHVGAYHEPSAAPTPHIDALAAQGVLFLDAVAPMPETAPSHASMMTGKHPLRHGVLSNGHELRRSHETVAEVLAGRGYSTAAFVSSFAVHSRTGLAQGFHVFDDDLSPVPGVGQIRLVEIALRVWMAFGDPASTPWLLERGGRQTTARFLDWLDGHHDAPFFAWVHYFEPHAPYEPWGLAGFDNGTPGAPKVDHRARLNLGPAATYTLEERRVLESTYREEVAYVDGLVGDVLAALDRYGLTEETLVIVTADHGEMLGEHGLDYVHHGLWDEVLRVPLVLRVPGASISRPEVAAQVRLYDLATTMTTWAGVEEEMAEGVDLVGYGTGARGKPLWLSLVGRRERSFAEGALIGMRNNGVKYIKDIVLGTDAAYDLADDPRETTDISWRSAEMMSQIRSMIEPEVQSFLSQIEVDPGVVTADEAAMLEALGYVDGREEPAAAPPEEGGK